MQIFTPPKNIPHHSYLVRSSSMVTEVIVNSITGSAPSSRVPTSWRKFPMRFCVLTASTSRPEWRFRTRTLGLSVLTAFTFCAEWRFRTRTVGFSVLTASTSRPEWRFRTRTLGFSSSTLYASTFRAESSFRNVTEGGNDLLF